MKSLNVGLVKEKTLLVYRISSLITVIGYNIYRLNRRGSEYFYFLTNWNWIVLIIYFTVASRHSYSCLKGTTSPIFEMIYRIGFALIQALSWTVTITYWILLANAELSSTVLGLEIKVDNIIAHSLNLILLLIDLFISRVQLAWKDAIYPILFALVYQMMVIAWKGLVNRNWPYNFVASINGGQERVNWGPIFAFAAGLSLFILLMHAITIGLIALRKMLLRKAGQMKPDGAVSQNTIVELV
jgi:hypothetical protein